MKKKYRILKIILFIIIFGGSIFLLFCNPRLRIEEWQIDGTKLSNKSKIINFLQTETSKNWGPFNKDNFFVIFFRKKYLSERLKNNFFVIKKVSIHSNWNKNPFNHLKVFIEEREKEGIWCNEDSSCFYYDNTGLLFRRSADSSGPFIIGVRDKASLNLSLGSILGNKKLVASLKKLYNNFSDIPKITIDEIDIINLNYDFIVKTSNGWALYFDPNVSVENQIKVFKQLLKEEKIKIGKSLQYIDLRIKNKAYLLR